MEGGAELYLRMCYTFGSGFITDQAELRYFGGSHCSAQTLPNAYIIFAVRPYPLHVHLCE